MAYKPKPKILTVDYVPSRGHCVRDASGARVSRWFLQKSVAERHRDELQRQEDSRKKRGPRPCLCCGTVFQSDGIHNRLCTSCRARDDGGSMSIPSTSAGKVRRAASF